MALMDARPGPVSVDEAIYALVGHTIQRLAFSGSNDSAPPRLVDADGARLNPWEVELLHWPPWAEAELRRGGYLSSQWSDQELWCNCTD
ncbi:MAG: hypothetical protein WAT67_11590 [Candidatus Contendobacter sp.]